MAPIKSGEGLQSGHSRHVVTALQSHQYPNLLPLVILKIDIMFTETSNTSEA